MHIVFLVGSYYPYYSAVAKCIGNLVEEMQNDHRITVIAIRDRKSDAFKEQYQNHTIIRTFSPRINTFQTFEAKSGIIPRFIVRILKFDRKIRMHLHRVTYRSELLKAFETALKCIDDAQVIIPACMPIEAVMAAIDYKENHRGVEIVPFLFDNYKENSNFRGRIFEKLKNKYHKAFEESIFLSSNLILHVPSWTDYIKLNYAVYVDRCREVEHPLIVEPTDHPHKNDRLKEHISLAYAGTVSTSVRPPDYTLRVLRKLLERLENEESFLEVRFLVVGNAAQIVKDFSQMFPHNVKYYFAVDNVTATEAIGSSNILLSIGNTDNSQMPSKVFEYMSFGKPIIHFLNNDGDPVVEILEKYPLSCCISQKENDTEGNAKKIENFINDSKFKTVPFSVVEGIFRNGTPRYIYHILKEEVLRHIQTNSLSM